MFVANLATKLNPIETLRNEIMHNRSIKDNADLKLEQNKAYQEAKKEILDIIDNFWKQEKTHSVGQFQQAEFILKTLLENLQKDEFNTIYYNDLDFAQQEADDIEDLKSQFLDIINDKLIIENQDDLEEMINDKINEIEELTDSKDEPANPFPGFSGRF